MHSASRERSHSPLALLRRVAPAAVVAAVLAGAVFAPAASAGTPQDVSAVLKDFSADGDIKNCAFSKSQLEYVRDQLGPDILAYAPDFSIELSTEIARWSGGACGSGGQNGGTLSYRASIKSAKIAKNRRSVKVKLRCPTTATASCKVKITGKLAGKSAAKSKSATVKAGKTKSVKVKLKSKSITRLKTKGGKLKMSAKTTGSTLKPATRSIKVSAS